MSDGRFYEELYKRLQESGATPADIYEANLPWMEAMQPSGTPELGEEWKQTTRREARAASSAIAEDIARRAQEEERKRQEIQKLADEIKQRMTDALKKGFGADVSPLDTVSIAPPSEKGDKQEARLAALEKLSSKLMPGSPTAPLKTTALVAGASLLETPETLEEIEKATAAPIPPKNKESVLRGAEVAAKTISSHPRSFALEMARQMGEAEGEGGEPTPIASRMRPFSKQETAPERALQRYRDITNIISASISEINNLYGKELELLKQVAEAETPEQAQAILEERFGGSSDVMMSFVESMEPLVNDLNNAVASLETLTGYDKAIAASFGRMTAGEALKAAIDCMTDDELKKYFGRGGRYADEIRKSAETAERKWDDLLSAVMAGNYSPPGLEKIGYLAALFYQKKKEAGEALVELSPYVALFMSSLGEKSGKAFSPAAERVPWYYSKRIREGLEDILSGKSKAARVLSGFSRVVLQTADMLVDLLNMPFEVVRGLVGATGAAGRWYIAKLTGNEKAAQNAADDIYARYRQMIGSGARWLMEGLQDIFGADVLHKYERATQTGQYTAFEYFPNNFFLSFVCAIFLDPLTYVTPWKVSPLAKAQKESGLLRNLLSAAPDVYRNTRTVLGLAQRGQRASAAYKEAMKGLRSALNRERGALARMVKDARKAAEKGEVYSKITPIARHLSSIDDPYYFMKAFKEMGVSGYVFDQFNAAFRQIAELPKDMRVKEWGRLLTASLGGLTEPWKKYLGGAALAGLREAGPIVTYYPKVSTAIMGGSEKMRKAVEKVAGAPGVRWLSRAKTPYPSFHVIDLRNPVAAGDEMYRISKYVGFDEATSRRISQRFVELCRSDIIYASTYVRNFENFVLAKSGLNRGALVLTHKTIPDVVVWAKAAFGRAFADEVFRRAQEASREVIDAFQDLVMRMADYVDSRMHEIIAKSGYYGGALEAVIQASPSMLKKLFDDGDLREWARLMLGSEQYEKLIPVLKDHITFDELITILVSGDITPAEARKLLKAVKKYHKTFWIQPEEMEKYEKIVQEYSDAERRLIGYLDEVAKARGGGSLLQVEAFFRHWSNRPGTETLGPSRGFAYIIEDNIIRQLTSPEGAPIPLSIAQLSHLHRFDPSLKDISHIFTNTLIPRFGQRLVEEWNSAINRVIGWWKRAVVGRGHYPLRSATMNTTKLFMHGAIDPYSVARYNKLLNSMPPEVVDVVKLAEEEALRYPFRFLHTRTDTWVGIRAAENPRRAIEGLYRYGLRDPAIVAYIKGGRDAAKSVIETIPACNMVANIHGGVDEYLNAIGKWVGNIEEYAPTLYDAIKFNMKAADNPAKAAGFLKPGARRFGMDDLERIIRETGDDFAVPYPLARTFTPTRSTKWMEKLDRMNEAANNLYSKIFGSGMVLTREAGYRTLFVSYYNQLVAQGVDAASAARAAANMAKLSINDILMDFTKSLVFEHEFQWIMPFLSDLRLETLSYLRMFKNNPKVFVALRHWLDASQRWIEERGYPQWARFTIPISIPGSEEKKWLNVPAFLLYPTLGPMSNLEEEGYGKIIAQELSPVSEYFAKQAIRALPQPLQNLPVLRDIKSLGFYGVEPYGILTPGISGRGTLKEKMALYEKINRLKEQAQNDALVREGKITPLRFAIENLSPEERKMLDPAINREISAIYKRIMENPEEKAKRVFWRGEPILSPKEIEEAYAKAVESLRGVLPGGTWVTGMLEPWFIPSGGTWTEEQMRQMGELEKYREEMEEKFGAAASQFPLPSEEIKQYSESLIREKPWLRPMLYKPGWEGGKASRQTWWSEMTERASKVYDEFAGQSRGIFGGIERAVAAPFQITQVANPRLTLAWELQAPDIFGPMGDENDERLRQEKTNATAKLFAWLATSNDQAAENMRGSLSMMGAGLGEDKDFYAQALKAFGYDEKGNPTRALRLWQEWRLARARRAQDGEDMESFREYALNWLKEQEEPISEEEKQAILNFWPLRTGETALGYPTYQTYYYGTPSPEYTPTGPVPADVGGKIIELSVRRAVLNEMKKKINDQKVVSQIDEELARINEQIKRLEEQRAGLSFPSLGANTYPFAGLSAMAAIERMTSLPTPLQYVAPMLNVPVPITTEAARESALAEVPETLKGLEAGPPPSYNVQRYLQMAPDERGAFISALKKLVSTNTYGRGVIPLTKEEALAISGRTINELMMTNRQKDASGLGKVVYYPPVGDFPGGFFATSSMPFDWLDKQLQDLLLANSTEAERANFRLSTEKSGGGRRRGGRRWYSRWWAAAGPREFSRSAPTPLDEYFMLPASKREEYLREHPELKQEWRKRKPGESDSDYKWRMYMMDLAEKYYGLPTRAARRDFLIRHPDLVAYFEGKRKNRDTYYMRAMARAFTHNPELWNRYLEDVHTLTEYFIEQKALIKQKAKTPQLGPKKKKS